MNKILFSISCVLVFFVGANAAIVFNGGELTTGTNWSTGAYPAVGETGTIDVDGTLTGIASSTYWQRGTVIIDSGAIITCTIDWAHRSADGSVLNNGTINAADDVLVQYGAMTLNAGSTTTCGDAWMAIVGGTITINDGTHSSGTGTGHMFGAQGGGTLNILGGTVTAGTYNFYADSTAQVGGSAVLQSASTGTGLVMDGDLDILSSWTGSWTVDSFNGNDWATEVAGGGWSIDGALITMANFAAHFSVSADGKTLTPSASITATVPDPSDGINVNKDTHSGILVWLSPGAYSLAKEVLYFRADNADWSDSANTTTIDFVTSGVSIPVALDYDRTYYWRVDSYEDASPLPICHTGTTWSFTTFPENQTPLKVYLLGGQSNMFGIALASGLPSELQTPQTDVVMYSDGLLRALQPRDDGDSGYRFGPEITFGRTLADAYVGQADVALIKYARGATTLANDWNPATGSDYSTFISTVDAGLAVLAGLYSNIEVVGMIWMQGETDAKYVSMADAYEVNLTNFIASIRSDVGIADLPFVIGQISEASAWTYGSTVRQAQADVSEDVSDAAMVVTKDLSLGPDTIHYDAPGQMTLGIRFAEAMMLLEAGCGDWGYAPGDIDRNCRVNLEDLAKLASSWMVCTLPDVSGCSSYLE